ncbi:MAG: LAGLIDADG family homing endonuclease [archaeon]
MRYNRIGFFSAEDRTLFFEIGKQVLYCDSWKQFCAKVGIQKSMAEYYRNGKLLLPEWLFLNLSEKFSSEKRAFFKSKIFLKPPNWGESIGGRKTSASHPEFIVAARASAREKFSRLPRNCFDLNQELSCELCEFVGAFMGDGHTGLYGSHTIVGFTGHAKLDDDYYYRTIIPAVKKLFHIETCYVWKKENIMRVTFHSKRLVELLIKRFGFPTGVKFDKILIPEEILHSSNEHIAAVLRGLFDTDGCVFFDKRKIYRNPYMRFNLTMYNPQILDQVVQALAKIGIHASRANSKRSIQITNSQNIEGFLRSVGFSNTRHISKVLQAYPDFNSFNPGTRLTS